eukprot:CAMPEP_0184858936 /NCGR_PEP_ID=MMETSP0580-20130426/3958_1 /TAXON_ID=1118495 /ORGANISM="Dactyliosolen fragilissimus" /LENGTH=722 /DNA_ID=CAMNT_0027355305 /DNA_START=163 /DNA_END=2331 /DNA_ORIENTATION=-
MSLDNHLIESTEIITESKSESPSSYSTNESTFKLTPQQIQLQKMIAMQVALAEQSQKTQIHTKSFHPSHDDKEQEKRKIVVNDPLEKHQQQNPLRNSLFSDGESSKLPSLMTQTHRQQGEPQSVQSFYSENTHDSYATAPTTHRAASEEDIINHNQSRRVETFNNSHQQDFDFTSMPDDGPSFRFPQRQNSFMRQSVGKMVYSDGNDVDMLQRDTDDTRIVSSGGMHGLLHGATMTQQQSSQTKASNNNETFSDAPNLSLIEEYGTNQNKISKENVTNENYPVTKDNQDDSHNGDMTAQDLLLSRKNQELHRFQYGATATHSNNDPNTSSNNNAHDMPPFYSNERPYYDHPHHNMLFGQPSCFAKFLQSTNIHRSFCFGAIDGFLTGAGIVSASIGLEFLTPTSSMTVQLTIVALAFAACASDSLCMAIGHAWSAYILGSNAIKNRSMERDHFVTDKADCKAKMVNALIHEGGMLKIDAMTIADTLEGYPDLFVSTIIGEGLFGGGGLTNTSMNGLSYGSLGSFGSLSGGSGGMLGHHGGGPNRNSYQQFQREEDFDPSTLSHYSMRNTQGSNPLNRRSKFHAAMYDEFNDAEDDPDQHELDLMVKDGWVEGISIMVAFCLFSVLPGFIYISVPVLISSGTDYDSYGISTNWDYEDGTGVSPISLTVSIASVIMLILGIWKSKYFQSNWVIFGIETVLVLYLCIFSAYGVGVGLRSIIQKMY